MTSDDTLELETDAIVAQVRAASVPLVAIDHGSASEIGQRDENQDAVGNDGLTWFAVADGMGGHAGGRLAATTVVQAVEELRVEGAELTGAQALAELQGRVGAAARRAGIGDIGTTLVLLLLGRSGWGELLHLGDSRAYRFRDGTLQLLTHDHTVASEVRAAGRDPEEFVRRGVRVDALTSFLGPRGKASVASRTTVDLRPSDRLVLCTDGVSRPLGDVGIARMLAGAAGADAQTAADALVRAALDEGGRDNATAVVIDVGHAVASRRS